MLNTKEFYQWDINKRLVIENKNIKEVHFSNVLSTAAIVKKVHTEKGINYVDIPNELLQQPYTISAYASCGDCVEFAAEIEVIKRIKPEDYSIDTEAVVSGSFTCSSNGKVVVEHNLNKLPSRIVFYADDISTTPSTSTSFSSYSEVLNAEAVMNENGEYENNSLYCTTSRMSYYSSKNATTASYMAKRTITNTNGSSGNINNLLIHEITETTFNTPAYLRTGITYYWIAFR